MPAEPIPAAAAPPRRLFYWCHTTSRQAFETGVQRVVRRLSAALGAAGLEIVPVGRDEGTGLIEIIGRGASAFETALAASRQQALLFIPEITADLVVRGIDPVCMGRAYGMRTTLFVHDLVPIKLRDHYPAEAVAMFAVYFESFARADAVLATTRGVADELRGFLEERALHVPPIEIVPLPAQFGDRSRATSAAPSRREGEPLKLVAMVSWERRKNLARLLRALDRAQVEAAIALTLVGRRGLDPAHDAEIEAQIAASSNVVAAGTLSDDAVVALMAASHATVYPSWEEGFGLPVGESLWLGRPCLCHDGSAMAVTAAGGGTLMIDMTNEAAIAAALVKLATCPALLARLSHEAVTRPLTSWRDYAENVAAAFDRLDATSTPAPHPI